MLLLALLVVLGADDGESPSEVCVGVQAGSAFGLERLSRVPGTHLLEVYALHVDCLDRLRAPCERVLSDGSSW